MEGWIKLHRKVCDNELYFSQRFTRGQAWIDLLLLAAHKAQTVFIRGVEIHLEPGQLCYSQLNLGKRWKWNFKTVKSFLSNLQKREMLETKTDNVTTVISIRNWAQYQSNGERTGDQNGDQSGEQKETRAETNKNVNTVKNEERDRAPLSIPENLESVKAFFRQEQFLDADFEAQKFFTRHEGKKWVGVLDWQASARTWNLRTLEYKRQNGSSVGSVPAHRGNGESYHCDCGKTVLAKDRRSHQEKCPRWTPAPQECVDKIVSDTKMRDNMKRLGIMIKEFDLVKVGGDPNVKTS